jgi:hypothetical protein
MCTNRVQMLLKQGLSVCITKKIPTIGYLYFVLNCVYIWETTNSTK